MEIKLTLFEPCYAGINADKEKYGRYAGGDRYVCDDPKCAYCLGTGERLSDIGQEVAKLIRQEEAGMIRRLVGVDLGINDGGGSDDAEAAMPQSKLKSKLKSRRSK